MANQLMTKILKSSDKENLRRYYLSKRNALSQKRHEEAQEALLHAFVTINRITTPILSYANFGSELCTNGINALLASTGLLALPKLIKSHMHIFKVLDMEKDLLINHFGIREPDANQCEELSLSTITMAFIPAVAFDRSNHRIGYGKGYYDRLLSEMDPQTHTIGLGFKEQLINEPLTFDSHDIPLSEVRLY